MASVDWQKMKSGSQKSAILRHCLREHKNYSNKQVDLSQKDQNDILVNFQTQINPKYNTTGFFKKEKINAKSELERLNERVQELDKVKPPKRIRKDRVTAVSFNVPLPDFINDRENAEKFFSDTYKIISDFCGGEKNVSVGVTHYDELHTYYDNLIGEYVDSRPHMHIMGIPWTDEYGVNCKNFMTKKNMRQLNLEIDNYCRENYKSPYLIRSGQMSRGTVEDLKRDSRAAGAVAQELGIMADFIEKNNLVKDYQAYKKSVMTKDRAKKRGQMEELER